MSDTIAQAIEDAARDLPNGYEILIHVENGSASVEIEDRVGNEVEFPQDDMGIAEQIRSAVQAAVSSDAGV